MTYTLERTKGRFPFHVVDRHGMPHRELTLYACIADQYHSAQTALAYTREVIRFASWAGKNELAARQGWTLLGDSSNVRALLLHFLNSEMKCVIAIGRDRAGFDTRRVEPTWETSRSVAKLLAALRSFYDVLRERKFYFEPNPMEGDEARQLIQEQRALALDAFRRENGRNPMNSESGVDRFRQVRSAAAYFRMNKDAWLPQVLDDPLLFHVVLQAGEKWGWNLRETVLARIMFDSGCRIHEACSLTFGDWADSSFGRTLKAINKGSHGIRVKRLFITDKTLKILQRYVDQERRTVDSKGRTTREFSKMEESELYSHPIFLTEIGTPLCPDHFRRNFWTPALEASNIKLRPHQSRHWFVTMALNDFAEQAKSEEELQNLRTQLRDMMGWKSDMLPAYDQAIARRNLPELAARIHANLESMHTQAITKLAAEAVSTPVQKSESELLLDEMFGL